MTWEEYYAAHKLEFETLDEEACAALENDFNQNYSVEAQAAEQEREDLERQEEDEERERAESMAKHWYDGEYKAFTVVLKGGKFFTIERDLPVGEFEESMAYGTTEEIHTEEVVVERLKDFLEAACLRS